ncbi:DnaJ (Hsp40) family B protein (macronuclear) [Tetrahymena thermophila SB210]|uniref:DnaJ (Hsp40) family B protein n=1 Tax=Tetrahymena thermophila (strain SB210) TaxID=312017 RepID=I7MGN3_TETTS|nr:DnaJ (Hsp40) family B protein [Tetrahymena thermophila SB210]EAR85350.2 DnaJ (Hsp40) family B protein [Tetrahymena thermophila SB210]|eukprot:XP_001033013.2 DnaJ (Hsp40) family B protein [Tetrahymena thermophila SB210]
MSRDYYEDLEISRDASDSVIAQAYRKLALRWHPQIKGNEDQQTRYSFFCKVSEAYEVLSDPVKRSFYDKYGEDKLKEGFFNQQALKGGYRFGGNPEEIFEKFFGAMNPFQQIYDSENQENVGSLFGYAFGAQNQSAPLPPKPLHVVVECTLAELYNGCSKNVTYQRTVLNKDGRTTTDIKESKMVEVKPGYKNGEQIKYPKLGNEVAGLPNSDLIFTVKELAHSTLKRKGNDLIYYHKLKLIDALYGRPVHFTTLDGRKLFVAIDQVISPSYVKKVNGEGMPIYNPQEYKVEYFGQPPNKGDLYIKFDIQFPAQIDDDKRAELEQILGQQSQIQ